MFETGLNLNHQLVSKRLPEEISGATRHDYASRQKQHARISRGSTCTDEGKVLGPNLGNDTAPETKPQFAPENRPGFRKGNDHIPTPSIFRCFVMLVSGAMLN